MNATSVLDILEDTETTVEDNLARTFTVVKTPSKRGRKSLNGTPGMSPRLGLAISQEIYDQLEEESKNKNETRSETVRRIFTEYFSQS